VSYPPRPDVANDDGLLVDGCVAGMPQIFPGSGLDEHPQIAMSLHAFNLLPESANRLLDTRRVRIGPFAAFFLRQKIHPRQVGVQCPLGIAYKLVA
jgi:hypothetical protein